MVSRSRLRGFMVVLAAVMALAIPATAGAWSWGYGYMSSRVTVGWSYWSYSSANKQNGGRIYQEWKTSAPGGSFCDNMIDGVTTYWSTPGDCGFGGYVWAEWGYIYGAASYVYAETN
jgi:hypothetical protein